MLSSECQLAVYSRRMEPQTRKRAHRWLFVYVGQSSCRHRLISVNDKELYWDGVDQVGRLTGWEEFIDECRNFEVNSPLDRQPVKSGESALAADDSHQRILDPLEFSDVGRLGTDDYGVRVVETRPDKRAGEVLGGVVSESILNVSKSPHVELADFAHSGDMFVQRQRTIESNSKNFNMWRNLYFTASDVYTWDWRESGHTLSGAKNDDFGLVRVEIEAVKTKPGVEIRET